MILVQEFLENSADRAPHKVGLICEGQRLTYAEIGAQASRLAYALTAHGLERGERVALYLPISVEPGISIFAALKAGGVFVVANHSTKYQRLAY